MDAAGKGLATEPLQGAAQGAGIVLRELRTLPELDACVRLQREVWGQGFSDVVPASLLKIGSEVGGIAAGAFAPGDDLVGFVYGLTGVRDGHLTHWSHMLGVLRSHRGMGIGLQLKHYQRDQLLSRGVGEMRWTFDPLVAGNAHFNLTLLGARIERYVPNMYGDMGSELHAFGTDRVVAHWDLRASATSLFPALPPASLEIEIPTNVGALGRVDPAGARAWRVRSRQAFTTALREGYVVVGFRRDAGEGTCRYLLGRAEG